MMAIDSTFRPLHAYVGALTLVLMAVLAGTIVAGEDFAHDIPQWILLIVLFAAAELYIVLFFHHERGRVGLSISEAVFLPMMVGFTFGQAVWGVTIAAVIIGVAHRRLGVIKSVFNGAQLGIAAAAAAGVWHLLSTEGHQRFGPLEAAIAALAVVVFAGITHLFVAGAISIAERRNFFGLSRDIQRATVVNLLLNISLGLLFAASYVAAHWTVVLFVLPLGAVFIGYRAVLRQEKERERVERLHEGAQALAASPDLDHAVLGFLRAVADTVSASQARLVLRTSRGLLWFGVAGDDVSAAGTPVGDDGMNGLLAEVESRKAPVIVAGLEGGPDKPLAEALDSNDLVAVPIVDGDEMVGCLMAVDRIGADDFEVTDARLLEALGQELVIALDSYRLFAEVAEERERFVHIFEDSKEGICLLDSAGVVRAWNPAMEVITGYSEAEVEGSVWSERVTVRDSHQRRVEGPQLARIRPDEELEVVTRQGPTRWISVLAGPVSTAGEQGWVVLVRDRTAEHAAEEAKSDFLSTISHELRTPLTSMKGSLQILGRGVDDLPHELSNQMIDVLSRGATRLERLVLNLLFVSQVEAGSLRVVPTETVAMDEVVREGVKRMKEEYAGPVEVDIVADGLAVLADREKLDLAVEALLDNAAKYGTSSAPIEVRLFQENSDAHLTVRDHGPGIPRADQERIFERFVRLGETLTRDVQGAGVGLFIARHSIEGMGGRIWVESGPGAGAIFHLTLPLGAGAPGF
jgi:PAS domain S-box-containing protein